MTVEPDRLATESTESTEGWIDPDLRHDLLSFAAELTGDVVTARTLLGHAVEHWRSLPGIRPVDTETGYAELRAWVARGYLSEGMTLGRPPAADVDDPVPADADAGDDLDHALRGSSKLRRATLLLRYRAGLDDVELARTVGSTPDGIAEYLERVLGELGVGSGGYTEDDVRDRLERHGEAVAGDLLHAAGPPVGALREGSFAWVDIVDPEDRAATVALPEPAPADPLLEVLTESLEAPTVPEHPQPGPAAGDAAPRRRRWVWFGVALLIVVTFAVVLAVVLGTRSGRAGGETQHPAALPVVASTVAAPVPSPITAQLPGTSVLGDYSGRGARTLHPEVLVPRPGFEVALGLACRGAGPVRAAAVVLADCTSPALAPVEAGLDTLIVQAPATTSWRAVLVEEPIVDTSGSLRSPPDPSLVDPHRPGVIASRRGAGTVTVRLPAVGPGVHALRVSLLCAGAGVELSGAGHAADGSYARGCIPGWSYEFDLAAVSLPAQLRVDASRATTWQVTVTLR